MFKTLSSVAVLVSTCFLLACNSNDLNSSIEFNSFGSCYRQKEKNDVVLTLEQLKLDKNTNGCNGNDDKLCDLRLYHIMVESFKHSKNGPKGYTVGWGPSSHGGNIRGVIESLSYIKSTGVNTIYLTPVFASYPIEGQDFTYNNLDATGYYTSDFFAIDPNFGTKEDLKELVRKAHAIGLYVILDGVFGHTKENVNKISPNGNKLELTRQCRTLMGDTEKMPLVLARCIDVKNSIDFLKEVAAYWIKEAKIDGWRLDQAYQVDNKYWQEIYQAVQEESNNPNNSYMLNNQKVQPLGYMVAEVWSEKPMPLEQNIFSMKNKMSAFDFPLRTEMANVFAINREDCGYDASSLHRALNKSRAYSQPAITTTFIGNHDIVRFGDLLQRAGYNKEGEFDKSYYQAHKALFSFISSVSGPLSMFYGDEVGAEVKGFIQQPENCSRVYQCDDHVARSDVDFENLSLDAQDLKNYISKLYNLRDKYKSLSHGIRKHLYSDNTLYVVMKEYNQEKILYVLNTGVTSRNLTITEEVSNKIGIDKGCSLINLEDNKKEFIGSAMSIKPLSGNFYYVNCK